MKNQYGKNVFVTGASSGIGKAIAEAFAAQGCNVIGTSRHCEPGTTAVENGSLTMMRMDVTNTESIHQVIAAIPTIDIAVMAAGMGVAGAAEELPVEMARRQIETNYLGVVAVGNEILPKMRKQGRGLFLVIGSIAGRVPIPMQSHYSSSKYALEAYVDAVRMEMKPYGVKACILEPGDTRTGFTSARTSYIAEDSPYKEICRASVEKMAKDEQNGRSPSVCANTAVKLSAKKNPPARVPIGLEYKVLMLILRLIPDRLKEWILSLMYLPKV